MWSTLPEQVSELSPFAAIPVPELSMSEQVAGAACFYASETEVDDVDSAVEGLLRPVVRACKQ